MIGRLGVALAGGAILVGFFVASADGRSARVVQLQLHGTIVLAGSKIQCSSGQEKGVTYIECGVPGPNGRPKRGGYVARMDARGRVRITATSTSKVVFSRVPAVVTHKAAPTTVKFGDTIELPGTSIHCEATRIILAPTLICYFVDKAGIAQPGSYTFAISDTFVRTSGYNAQRDVQSGRSWKENG